MSTVLRLRLCTRSAVALSGGQSDGNFTPGLRHLPGSALRGAVAARLLREMSADDPLFQDLFLSGRVAFGNATPAIEAVPAQSLPLSARSCKRHAGFLQDRGHGVSDVLLRQVQANLHDDLAPVLGRTQCRYEGCDMALYGFAGFAVAAQGRYKSVRPDTQVLTRTAIAPATQTAQTGGLFSLGAIAEEQPFVADLVVHDDRLIDPLNRCLVPGTMLRLGQGSTRGLGMVEVQGLAPAPMPVPLTERLERFQQVLADLAQEYGIALDGRYFALTLTSDAILTDPFFRYRSEPDASWLSAQVGAAVERVQAATHMVRVQGWHAARQLPKAVELAVGRGAVFVYRTQASVDQLLPGLARLEAVGLGDRRDEGFGRLVVCDPFHVDGELEVL